MFTKDSYGLITMKSSIHYRNFTIKTTHSDNNNTFIIIIVVEKRILLISSEELHKPPIYLMVINFSSIQIE